MIEGQRREEKEFTNFVKRVGLFEANVVAINPTEKEYTDKKLGPPLEEGKTIEYLSESDEGNQKLRIDVYLEDVNDKPVEGENKKTYKVAIFLENKERENQEMTKKQYINAVGTCSWGATTEDLFDWFKERDYRVAMSGEEELYTFLTNWLKLDYKNPETILEIEWKKLMKGDLSELKSQIGEELCGSFIALATVKIKETEDGVKEYQSVYNKAYLPTWAMKNFRLLDYDDDAIVERIEQKKPRDRKAHEKFTLNVKGEYGCRDYYILKPIKDYDPEENLVASNDPKSEDSPSY